MTVQVRLLASTERGGEDQMMCDLEAVVLTYKGKLHSLEASVLGPNDFDILAADWRLRFRVFSYGVTLDLYDPRGANLAAVVPLAPEVGHDEKIWVHWASLAATSILNRAKRLKMDAYLPTLIRNTLKCLTRAGLCCKPSREELEMKENLKPTQQG